MQETSIDGHSHSIAGVKIMIDQRKQFIKEKRSLICFLWHVIFLVDKETKLVIGMGIAWIYAYGLLQIAIQRLSKARKYVTNSILSPSHYSFV